MADKEPDGQDGRQPEKQSPRKQDVSERAGILPPQHWTAHASYDDRANANANAPVDPDADDDDDGDSAFGGDDGSSTASLTSSILRYRSIHGRTYHSERGNAHYWYDSSNAPTLARPAMGPLTKAPQGIQRRAAQRGA
jgi:hypothetical protein